MVIIKATALEILSEPLSLLILLASLTLTVLAPAFHYHQFGEASRMARDAGFSALFTGGTILAIFETIRVFRREIESGTLAMALSHPISRSSFFMAKTIGAFCAFAVFALIVAATTLTIVTGSEIGGKIADKSGDIARIWGPSLAIGVGTILAPLVLGAMANRFFHCRFVLSAFVIALVVAAAGTAYRFDGGLVQRLLPVFAVEASLSVVYLVCSAAFAMRLKANAAATCVGIVFALTLPVIGNYYLADALSGGKSVPLTYAIAAVASVIPAVAAFLVVGRHFAVRCEVS